MGNLTKQRSDVNIKTSISSAHGNVIPEADLNLTNRATFDSATSTYQFSDTITGGSDEIDLVGGLLDDLGDSVTFQKIHLAHYKNTSATGGIVTFSDNFSMTSAIALTGGAYNTYINETGHTITPTTNDVITITGETGLTYDVVIIGRKPA